MLKIVEMYFDEPNFGQSNHAIAKKPDETW